MSVTRWWHGLAWVVLIVLSTVATACDSWRTYRVPLRSGEALNQDVAIRVSTEVIREAGYNPDGFELFPIREKEPEATRYFGTSSQYPPHGYIMWKRKSAPQGEGVTISMEVRDGVAI